MMVIWSKTAKYQIRVGAIAPGVVHTKILDSVPQNLLDDLVSKVIPCPFPRPPASHLLDDTHLRQSRCLLLLSTSPSTRALICRWRSRSSGSRRTFGRSGTLALHAVLKRIPAGGHGGTRAFSSPGGMPGDLEAAARFAPLTLTGWFSGGAGRQIHHRMRVLHGPRAGNRRRYRPLSSRLGLLFFAALGGVHLSSGLCTVCAIDTDVKIIKLTRKDQARSHPFPLTKTICLSQRFVQFIDK